MVKNGDVPAEVDTDHYTHYLDNVLAGITASTEVEPIKERAHHFASQHPANPTDEHLFAHVALNAEAEVRAIEIRVRR